MLHCGSSFGRVNFARFWVLEYFVVEFNCLRILLLGLSVYCTYFMSNQIIFSLVRLYSLHTTTILWLKMHLSRPCAFEWSILRMYNRSKSSELPTKTTTSPPLSSHWSKGRLTKIILQGFYFWNVLWSHLRFGRGILIIIHNTQSVFYSNLYSF